MTKLENPCSSCPLVLKLEVSGKDKLSSVNGPVHAGADTSRTCTSPAVTHHLIFHAGKDDIQHLGKRGLGGGLIDEVFAGQVDIVACPHCLQDSAFMDFNVWGGHCSQKSLRQGRNGHLPECPCSPVQTFLE